MAEHHFDPQSYAETIRVEIPLYDELEERLAAATAGVAATRVLDLGAGTGETTRRVLALHPDAELVATDLSPAMLARIDLPRVTTVVRRLEEPLPEGQFDLVVSALAVHHLEAAAKRDLFRRLFDAVRRSGRFVLGDVVAVEEPVAPLTAGWDRPDAASDQVRWLGDAGFGRGSSGRRRTSRSSSPTGRRVTAVDGFSFSSEIRVRFAETDAQGIAHNASYFVWFEVARVEYLRGARARLPAAPGRGRRGARPRVARALPRAGGVRRPAARPRALPRRPRRAVPLRVRRRAGRRRDRRRVDRARHRRGADAAADADPAVARRGDRYGRGAGAGVVVAGAVVTAPVVVGGGVDVDGVVVDGVVVVGAVVVGSVVVGAVVVGVVVVGVGFGFSG